MSNRTEWINRITDQLINPYYTFIENTAAYGRKIAKTKKKQRPLMEFQKLLEKVPLLDTTKQLEVYNNYCRDIDCTNLTKNITNCFVSNAKVYSSVQDAASKGKRIDLNIPETPRFFYECLIDIARESWEKAYLLNKNGTAIDIQKRVQMSKDLIKESIAKSVRRLVTDAIVITDKPVVGGGKDEANDEDDGSKSGNESVEGGSANEEDEGEGGGKSGSGSEDDGSKSGSESTDGGKSGSGSEDEVDVQINKQSGGSDDEGSKSESHEDEDEGSKSESHEDEHEGGKSESKEDEGAMVVSDVEEPEQSGGKLQKEPESIKIKFDVHTPHDIKMMKMLDGEKDKEPEPKSDGVFFDLDAVTGGAPKTLDEDDIEDDDDPSEVDPKPSTTTTTLTKKNTTPIVVTVPTPPKSKSEEPEEEPEKSEEPEEEPEPEPKVKKVVKQVVKKVSSDSEPEESVGGSNVKISKKEFEQFQKLKKFYKTQVEKKKQLELVKQVVQEELQKIKQPSPPRTRAVKRVKKRGATKSSKCLIDN